MPLEILMPALSPTMTEGKLVRWLKKEGDFVKNGQVVAEVETDKATMEIEAAQDGKIAKIVVAAGTPGVKVGAVLAILLEGEESPSIEALVASVKAKAEAADGNSSAHNAKPAKETKTASDAARDRAFASPLARRIAEQAGINLAQIPGTGPNGRIVLADVEIYIANMKAKSNVIASPPPASKISAGAGASPARTPPAAPLVPPVPEKDGLDATASRRTEMSIDAVAGQNSDKLLVGRLPASYRQASRFDVSIDCEIDELLKLRQSINETYRTQVSVNDCVIRAVALALRKVPAINMLWAGEALSQSTQSDIAVAVPTANGFVMPIVHQAEDKTLMEISAEIEDFSSQLQGGRLSPEEGQGGSIAVLNLSSFGVRQFSPTVNSPQVCSLAIGAGTSRAVVKNGKLAVATVMTCVLSVDSSAVNELVAAEFLAAFKPFIEQPYGLLV